MVYLMTGNNYKTSRLFQSKLYLVICTDSACTIDSPHVEVHCSDQSQDWPKERPDRNYDVIRFVIHNKQDFMSLGRHYTWS